MLTIPVSVRADNTRPNLVQPFVDRLDVRREPCCFFHSVIPLGAHERSGSFAAAMAAQTLSAACTFPLNLEAPPSTADVLGMYSAIASSASNICLILASWREVAACQT